VSRARWAFLSRGLGLALLAFIAAFPLLAGSKFVNDEPGLLNHLHGVWGRLSVADAVSLAWNSHFFRPLDHLIAPVLSDPRTRAAWPVVWLHWPGALVLLAGLRVALRRLVPNAPLAFSTALIVWCLHTATTLTMWQPDCIGQTWSAAAGVWLLLALATGIERARQGGSTLRTAALLVGISVVGVLTKETFYGWCFAGGVLLVVSFLRSSRQDGSLRWGQWAPMALGSLLLPTVFLLLRLLAGGFGDTVAGG
jgi:hypothetical protein